METQSNGWISSDYDMSKQAPMHDKTIEERFSRLLIPAVRIVAGLLWLENLNWKRPGDFGQRQKNGLFKYVQYGIDHKVLTPYSWVLQHVIVKHITLFGWSTLLLESFLAASLLVGWKVRWVSLIGATQALAIGLSVLNSPGEWPWSYYLMIALHLALFALAAGQIAGLDGLPTEKWGTAATTAGAISIAVGVWGFVRASSLDFTAHVGSLIFTKTGELQFLRLNSLGALVTLIIGVVVVVGARLKSALLTMLGGAAFAVLVLIGLIQWRNPASGETGGIFGVHGGTIGFWLALAMLVLVPSVVALRSAKIRKPTAV
jgi:thiosulfate dehydrogenase (quinone) large subunit